jgi:DNA-binding NarL/FixJ family response regulator
MFSDVASSARFSVKLARPFTHFSYRPRVNHVRIVIADEHPIFRDGLRWLLETEPGLHVAGDAADSVTAAALVRDLNPDVLLLRMTGSGRPALDTLREVDAAGASVRTILLTTHVDTPEVLAALRLGARGVVPTDSSVDVLFESLRTVMAGHFWIGHHSVSNASAGLRKLNTERRRTKAFGLTRRELQIVQVVVAGHTNKEIASRLSITENTIKRHLTHVFNKIGASSRVELALFASYHRLLDSV